MKSLYSSVLAVLLCSCSASQSVEFDATCISENRLHPPSNLQDKLKPLIEYNIKPVELMAQDDLPFHYPFKAKERGLLVEQDKLDIRGVSTLLANLSYQAELELQGQANLGNGKHKHAYISEYIFADLDCSETSEAYLNWLLTRQLPRLEVKSPVKIIRDDKHLYVVRGAGEYMRPYMSEIIDLLQ